MSDFLNSAGAIAGVIPGARSEVIAGAGHLAPLETPDVFRSLLLDLLGTASET
jgi:pimeloyl-ACP methyl ester carboxylesterase